MGRMLPLPAGGLRTFDDGLMPAVFFFLIDINYLVCVIVEPFVVWFPCILGVLGEHGYRQIDYAVAVLGFVKLDWHNNSGPLIVLHLKHENLSSVIAIKNCNWLCKRLWQLLDNGCSYILMHIMMLVCLLFWEHSIKRMRGEVQLSVAGANHIHDQWDMGEHPDWGRRLSMQEVNVTLP